jgi:hypothetical protein
MENLAMNNQKTIPTEENKSQAEVKAASVEPVAKAKKKADGKSKLIPRTLNTKVENGDGENDREFTVRIASIKLKQTAPGRYQPQVQLISKKETSHDYPLKTCESGFERDVFGLLTAMMAAKRLNECPWADLTAGCRLMAAEATS